MPQYEYECKYCGHTESKLQTYEQGEKPLACPKCGANMKRQAGNIAHFEFKGNLLGPLRKRSK
jgi:putative FmdB family regulatory protein